MLKAQGATCQMRRLSLLQWSMVLVAPRETDRLLRNNLTVSRKTPELEGS